MGCPRTPNADRYFPNASTLANGVKSGALPFTTKVWRTATRAVWTMDMPVAVNETNPAETLPGLITVPGRGPGGRQPGTTYRLV